MLILRYADVSCGDAPVHLGGSTNGIGHRLETGHQSIAKAFDQDSMMAG